MNPLISDAAFRPEEMFVGAFEGWGVMETPLGALQKRYVVEAEGQLLAVGKIDFAETWRLTTATSTV